MDNGKNSGSMVVKKNQFTELMIESKAQLETNLKNWVAKHPVIGKAAVDSLIGAGHAVDQGVTWAAICWSLSCAGSIICASVPVLKPFKGTPRGRLIFARDVGFLVGVNAGITCAMKRKQEMVVQKRMVAKCAAGVMWSIIRREPPAMVIATGVMFALLDAAIFKVREEHKSRWNKE